MLVGDFTTRRYYTDVRPDVARAYRLLLQARRARASGLQCVLRSLLVL